MQIIEMNIDDLMPYLRNAKIHDTAQIKNIAQSIKEFGFVQPIVVDKDNNVIIGHGRLQAAKSLDYKVVPVVSMDELTAEQANKLRLLDNKLNESEWDLNLLQQELEDLDFSDFDIEFDLPDDE